MNMIYIWLIGWLIMSILYYIYKVYIDKDTTINKKVHIWHAFWIGIISWCGIMFCIACLIVCLIIMINDFVEDKLNK